jgi:hypothetical protein
LHRWHEEAEAVRGDLLYSEHIRQSPDAGLKKDSHENLIEFDVGEVD